MRNSPNKTWPTDAAKSSKAEKSRNKQATALQSSNNGPLYCNSSIVKARGSNSYTHGGFGNIPSDSSKSVDSELLHNFGLKSSDNHKPTSRFTRFMAALTMLSVIASGSSALLGRELISDEEKDAQPFSTDSPIGKLSIEDYSKVKNIVVGTIIEDGLLANRIILGQSFTFNNPIANVKEKGAKR